MLEVHNLYAGYDGRNITQDVSLQIPEENHDDDRSKRL